MIAFEKFKEIQKLESIQQQHREWLKFYEGKHYSIAEDGKHKIKWATEKREYKNSEWTPAVNCIKELGNRLRIEFDGDETKAKEDLEITYNKLKENKWGFIRSTHKGKSDYLWIEFTTKLTEKQKKSFLQWIAPEKSEIDLNFSSPNKVFPVLFAIHWKHSLNREMPIEYFEGEQIDYKSLQIPETSAGRVVTKLISGNFKYSTFKKASSIFSIQKQAETFGQIQPLFYDKAGNFWLWCSEDIKWKRVDDIDILNMIADTTGEDTITSKSRTEILNALKQYGRKKIPKDIKTTWIQFKNKIYDLENGNIFEATPEYFVTNPIPYSMSETTFETPNMDRIFEEWVGKEYTQTLYEIISYCLLPDYPLHRIFCFIGSGMNGKSKFLDLLKKFIGKENCCSTELDTLIGSRFEVTRLHRKLVCLMGETNFNEMNKTSIIKKLSGGDLIGFEYKNKDTFEDRNYAKILIATNNLPTTTDKTIGFYRRWSIIDFPNQFSEKKDILGEIPEEEYNALASKCAIMLRHVLEKREFHKEGTIEERIEKYESKSNFLETFLRKFTEQDVDGHITKADFYKKFNSWCKENRHREMSETSVGLAMKKLGVESDRKYFDWLYDGKGGQIRVWMSIKWKEN
jgi:P4 family phage/plasmid primase-like protien